MDLLKGSFTHHHPFIPYVPASASTLSLVSRRSITKASPSPNPVVSSQSLTSVTSLLKCPEFLRYCSCYLALSLSCQYSVSIWLLFLCFSLKASSCQDSRYFALAPLRTNLMSKLPIQEAFPVTTSHPNHPPIPTLQNPTEPQGLKMQERKGPQGHGKEWDQLIFIVQLS